ncbi:MAG: beta-lactamase family protein [Gemmatimonadetes bacterium]|nr:beta-lactamase family protein [Gemmatimonadota bacterium]
MGRYVDSLTHVGAFSGVVRVAKDGDVLFEQAYGLAHRDPPIPTRSDTRFNLASIGKMFTAVAVLQLAEQGKLSLQDPIAKYLPGILPPEIGSKIRIAHLLTHTSGLGDFTQEPFADDDPRSWRDDLRHLRGAALESEPGTGWAYSNAGYLLLGAVVENVSGEDFHDYLRRHVYEPAGMNTAGEFSVDQLPPNTATGYTEEKCEGGTRLVSVYRGPSRGGPAGGNFASATDLHRFAQALLKGRLLRPETVREMLSPRPELNSPRYGYGVQLFGTSGSDVGHSGGAPGMNNYLRVRLDQGYVFVALSNTDTGGRLAIRKIAELASPPDRDGN